MLYDHKFDWTNFLHDTIHNYPHSFDSNMTSCNSNKQRIVLSSSYVFFCVCLLSISNSPAIVLWCECFIIILNLLVIIIDFSSSIHHHHIMMTTIWTWIHVYLCQTNAMLLSSLDVILSLWLILNKLICISKIPYYLFFIYFVVVVFEVCWLVASCSKLFMNLFISFD